MFTEAWEKPIAGQAFGEWAWCQGANGGPAVWYVVPSGSDFCGAAYSPTPTQGDPPIAGGFATPNARHTGGANVAFTDGHVKLIKFNNIYAPPSGTALKNFQLWHPDAT